MKYLALDVALNTGFDLSPCSYVLDAGANMVKYCNEGRINYLKLFGL